MDKELQQAIEEQRAATYRPTEAQQAQQEAACLEADQRQQIRTMEAIAQRLRSAFMHRMSKDISCARCGDNSRPVAFHILEKWYSPNAATPKGFVPMSASLGTVRGSFPICDRCAPPCSKCYLPVPSERVIEFGLSIGANIGNGLCHDHIHWVNFIQVIFKRAFKIGRFKEPR